MAMRSHDPKKAPQNSTFLPVNSQFQPRPFPVQEKPQTHETPDLQAQLESAQRFGLNFANISISAPNSSTPPIQPKLTIGEPGDKYEQEADKTAAEVVQRLHAPMPSYGRELSQPESQLAQTIKAGMVQSSNAMHQQGIPNHQNKLMRKLDVSTLQREVMPEEEEEKELQMKPMIQCQSSEDGQPASPDLEASIQQARGSGQPLAQSICEPMEQAFGADFSRVKIHTDAQSNHLNRLIQAKAFTTGQDIFFREGAYEPGSRGGQELIAHELTHVVQQNGSAVQRSLQDNIGKVSNGLPLSNVIQAMSAAAGVQTFSKKASKNFQDIAALRVKFEEWLIETKGANSNNPYDAYQVKEIEGLMGEFAIYAKNNNLEQQVENNKKKEKENKKNEKIGAVTKLDNALIFDDSNYNFFGSAASPKLVEVAAATINNKFPNVQENNLLDETITQMVVSYKNIPRKYATYDGKNLMADPGVMGGFTRDWSGEGVQCVFLYQGTYAEGYKFMGWVDFDHTPKAADEKDASKAVPDPALKDGHEHPPNNWALQYPIGQVAGLADAVKLAR